MSTKQDEKQEAEYLKPQEVCCGEPVGVPIAGVAKQSKFFVITRNKAGEVTHMQEIKFYGVEGKTNFVEFEEVGIRLPYASHKEKYNVNIGFTILAENYKEETKPE